MDQQFMIWRERNGSTVYGPGGWSTVHGPGGRSGEQFMVGGGGGQQFMNGPRWEKVNNLWSEGAKGHVNSPKHYLPSYFIRGR